MKRYLIPALASLIAIFGVWLYTGDTTTSLIIGLLTNLTFLVIEYFKIIAEVSDYLKLHSGLTGLPNTVVSATNALRQLENRGTALQKWMGERAFDSLNDNLLNISGGRWVLHSVEGFVDLAEKLFASDICAQEYCGTSIVSDYKAYWRSALGKRFQDLTVNAIKRGVMAKRVFIFETPEDKVSMEPIMTEQARLQIHVRYIMRRDVPIGTSAIDFGIWNSTTAVELSEAQYEGSAFRATLHLNAPEVRHLREAFDSLFGAAIEFRC